MSFRKSRLIEQIEDLDDMISVFKCGKRVEELKAKRNKLSLELLDTYGVYYRKAPEVRCYALKYGKGIT